MQSPAKRLGLRRIGWGLDLMLLMQAPIASISMSRNRSGRREPGLGAGMRPSECPLAGPPAAALRWARGSRYSIVSVERQQVCLYHGSSDRLAVLGDPGVQLLELAGAIRPTGGLDDIREISTLPDQRARLDLVFEVVAQAIRPHTTTAACSSAPSDTSQESFVVDFGHPAGLPRARVPGPMLAWQAGAGARFQSISDALPAAKG